MKPPLTRGTWPIHRRQKASQFTANYNFAHDDLKISNLNKFAPGSTAAGADTVVKAGKLEHFDLEPF